MNEYIERKALMKYADTQPGGLISNKSIQFFQAADVAPVRRGRWEKCDNLKPKCSVCGEYHLYAWSDYRKCNYCPNCGAKMDGELK